MRNYGVSSPHGNTSKKKVKLTSFGLYKAREKDYCAGFNCFVKQGNNLRNVLNLQTQESQHMTGYTKGMSYFYAKMTNNH